MNVLRCNFQGLAVIEPKVFGDSRGFFFELWNQKRFEENGMGVHFVQDNISFSRQGILRGLHYQNPKAQAKLVTVLQGEVFDVAVDLRRSSPSFGKWFSVALSGENKRQFFIPPGFAHGFQVVSESALFHYKCSEAYSPGDELSVRWDDPELAIDWPIKDPVLSDKDKQGLFLRQVPPSRLFD